jgi:glycosyltransferase involved in cell wall biosynthesis
LRGIGRYVRGLVKGLSHISGGPTPGLFGLISDPHLGELSVIEQIDTYCARPAQPPAPFAAVRRSALLSFDSASLAKRERALIHLTDPKGIPWFTEQPYSLTCHDLIPLILRELYLPKVPRWELLYAAIERFRYRRPLGILAVSHATKRDLCNQLGIEPSRVSVVWHGVDHELFNCVEQVGERAAVSRLVGSTDDFILYLGAGDARKDLGTLLSAYAQSSLCGKLQLVIAGHIGKARELELKTQANRLRLGENLKLLGYVPEGLVPALYRSAWVHVFPSRYEGFGLPVLEALACGAPTITSPGSSLDEVAGDAALIAPCGDVEALEDALSRLSGNGELRRDLRRKGLARTASFTWEATARATLTFWQELGARRE